MNSSINCAPSPVRPDDGKFIAREKAAADLLRYMTVNGIDPNDENAVVGYTIGVDYIRRLLYNMDLYNSRVTNPDEVVTGLRVYHALTESGEGDHEQAVFFMPVMSNGFDLHKVMPVEELPNTIVGETRPCPNQCSFVK